jgi:exopolysaccharide biosynthesis polyprenyl glycosylphosphotransferase
MMRRAWRERNKRVQVSDLIAVSVAFVLAIGFAHHGELATSLYDAVAEEFGSGNSLFLLGTVLLCSIALFLVPRRVDGLFAPLRRNLGDAALTSSLATGSAILLMWLFGRHTLDTNFALSFWLTGMGISLALRTTRKYRGGLGQNHVPRRRNVLIVGTNTRAIEFSDHLAHERNRQYSVVGFADDKLAQAGSNNQRGIPLVCSLDNVGQYLSDHAVDEVALMVPLKSGYEQASRIVAACEEQGVVVRMPSPIFPVGRGRWEPERLGEGWTIVDYTGAMKGPKVLLKRLLDVVGASTILLLMLPLLSLVALGIKATSRGPVFFVQDRVGLNKRTFRLYKFRTMSPDAEVRMQELEDRNEATGPVFKIKDDPRITGIGGILRKTSLDEFPQLLNVLCGDMSLVGPRPLPLRDYAGFTEDWQRRRLSVRPGITCLWQVQGRSTLSFERWMQLDLEYIDNWSLWLDVKILLRTIPAVVRGTGAE